MVAGSHGRIPRPSYGSRCHPVTRVHLNPRRDLIVDMDGGKSDRHLTLKKSGDTDPPQSLSSLLEDSAREAYARPWHRIERGLRLNRLRLFIEDVAKQYEMTKEEKEGFFVFLQKSLDKKLLNTIKVVQYDPETQRIQTIKGLEMKRNPEGVLKWGFSVKKVKADGTRKKKKDDAPSVSTIETAKFEE